MANISRNAPCSCGSGKKFKRCCANANTASPPPDREFRWVADFSDPLDILSNQIPDLIRARKFDDAESVCQKLRQRFPDEIDWRERYAELYDAIGDAEQAAAHYRLAADFAATHEDFDPDHIAWMRHRADQLSPTTRPEPQS
jgi:tetratricopeptide (TPR) repeat protein